jgi:surface polysaccharide O-acyltransferase-like enzyme
MTSKKLVSYDVKVKRNANIEALRVIMMLFIIMLHMSGQYYNIDACRLTGHSIEYSSVLSLRMLLMLGVNTFAFISGYFGIRSVSVRGGHNKVVKYELLAWSWGIIFIVIDIMFSGIHPRHILDLLLPTASGICWYFSAYMYMLMISQILNRGIENIDKRQYQALMIFLLLVEFVGGTLYHYNGTTLTQLLFIYVIGQYLRKYPIQKIEKNPVQILMIATGINIALVFACSYYQIGGDHITRLLESNKNPLVLISSISLFMAAKNKKQSKLLGMVGRIAPYMFSVYISHVILLYLNIIDFRRLILISPIVSVFAISISILLLGTLADKIRVLLFGKVLDKSESTIENIIKKI